MEVILKYKLPQEENNLKNALNAEKYSEILCKIVDEIDSCYRDSNLNIKEVHILGRIREWIPEELK